MSASTELEFKGYQSFDAQPDDQYRIKWQAVRAPLDLTQIPTTLPDFSGITHMNLKINVRIKYVAEAPEQDYWQPPAVTLAKGTGDCEDYAILKYAVLLKSGIPEDQLRLVVGEIANDPVNEPHAWCAVCLYDPSMDENKWWALDNKFDQLADAETYINWVPKAAMWGDKVTRYGVQTTIKEVLDRQSKGVV